MSEETNPVVDEKPATKTRSRKAKSDRIKVRFHNQEGVPGGTDAIFVGVNGRGYQIQREQDVELPNEVIHAIDNAVITKTERDSEGNEVDREIHRFPYSRVG